MRKVVAVFTSVACAGLGRRTHAQTYLDLREQGYGEQSAGLGLHEQRIPQLQQESYEGSIALPLKRLTLFLLALQHPTTWRHALGHTHQNAVPRQHSSVSMRPFEHDAREMPFRMDYASGLLAGSSVQAHAHMTWMDAMQEQLHAMRDLGFEILPVDERFAVQTNEAKGAKIVNMAFKSKVFRKVRLTYFDAGDKVQVFNSVFYPSYEYDLPMLGIDLISLNRKNILVGVDFQPLYPTEEYSQKYIEHLTPIRAKYESLQGSHSGKIYEDVSFFSKNMLFGRFSNESSVNSEAIPASNEYLHAYLKLAETAIPDSSEASVAAVRERQARYDVYQAEVDPAIGLFNSYFGKEWSESYVHDFLFELSRDGKGAS